MKDSDRRGKKGKNFEALFVNAMARVHLNDVTNCRHLGHPETSSKVLIESHKIT